VLFSSCDEVRAFMPVSHDTMMSPPIEDLLERAGSKFSLVLLSAKRAREINSYFNQLGEGLGTIVPPQVTSVARKPLSIAYEEIGSDKIVLTRTGGEELATEPGAGDVILEAVQPSDADAGDGGDDVDSDTADSTDAE
jgi:DNA-directed RNA polymerase subunit omega